MSILKSILKEMEIGQQLFGNGGGSPAYLPTATGFIGALPPSITHGTAMSASKDGHVIVMVEGTDTVVQITTDVACSAGDYLTITITGTQMKVTGVIGAGDRAGEQIQGAVTAAVAAANVASEALKAAEMVQDKANDAAAAALTAEQKAEAARVEAEAAKNELENQARDILVAQEKANNAAMDALLAQITAAAKTRNFAARPQPPYSVGDTWTTDDGQLLVCKKTSDSVIYRG